MIRLILLLALLMATPLCSMGSLSHAANTVPLSVDSLFRLIDDRNRTIKLNALCVKDAEAGENASHANLLPQINASLSIGYLGNGYVTDRDFGNGMVAHNPHSANNFALEAMQIIYSGGALTGSIRMAELNTNMSHLKLEESRQQVRFLLVGWLIDLKCLHNRQRVIDENITLAQQVIDNMRARYEEGVVLKNDMTRYELQLQDLRLRREKNNEAIRTTNYRLANALGFPANDTEFVPLLPDAASTGNVSPESNWQEKALHSNLTLRQAELNISMSETQRKIVAAERRPKLGLFAYGRFDSPIVTEVPVLNKNIMYWGLGVSVSLNLSSFYTSNHRMRQARVAEMESREAYDIRREHVQNEVEGAYENYQTALSELHTQEKSLELARQNYTVTNDRYNNGMALVTDMVDAANVRLASEIGVENARTQLLFCYYKLKYTTNSL